MQNRFNRLFGEEGNLSQSLFLESLCKSHVAGPAARWAFTLAEVLVTLGIIGVVSAMTLPTLVKNHQRQVYVNQLHKVYNEVSQAAELYMTDNNVVSLTESRIRNNPVELKRFFNTYFKVTKDCNTRYLPCFADEYGSIEGVGTTKVKDGQCNIVVALASGAVICADVAVMKDVTDKNEDGEDVTISSSNHVGNGGDVIAFEVDVNGKQGPNIYGRDFFAFQIDRNGVIFDKFYNKETGEVDFAAVDPDTGIFGKIMNDGWKMDY